MRGKHFFDRIKSIKNLKWVPTETSSFELLGKSEFVSTVTGTAGWEAITGGKKALIFGYAWYRSLPGVFEYDEGLKFEDMINYRFDHSRLEKKLALLLTKTGKGVVESNYSCLVKNYDKYENGYKVGSLIMNIINRNLYKIYFNNCTGLRIKNRPSK